MVFPLLPFYQSAEYIAIETIKMDGRKTHELNGFLKDFGNSGFSVRPTERRKGYATRMLGMIRDMAKDAGLTSLQLSVERTNEPSVRTIVKNGGVYERSFEFEGEAADVYRIFMED